jgi:hypothetical protein
MTRGGARPGAGRKKGARKSNGYQAPAPPQATGTRYESAELYLAAVVSGEEPADRDRITAAKAMLPYQSPRLRTPLQSPAPRQMNAKSESSLERQQREEWARKSESVRLKLVKNKGK